MILIMYMYTCTFVCMSSSTAMQYWHFRKAEARALNPPMLHDARLSADTTVSVPRNATDVPSSWNWTPPSFIKNRQTCHRIPCKLTLEAVRLLSCGLKCVRLWSIWSFFQGSLIPSPLLKMAAAVWKMVWEPASTFLAVDTVSQTIF